MTDTATATPPSCEARTRYVPGAFGFEPQPCGQSRGLRVLTDATGAAHYFCAASGHAESVAMRFGAIRQLMAARSPMYEGMD